MRRRDDDDAEMSTQRWRLRAASGHGDPGAGSQLSAGDVLEAELDSVVQELRELGRMRAPTPSAELQALLAHGLPSGRHRWTRKRTVIVGALLTGSMTMGLTGVAAATDRLPGRSQDVVAGVINDLTPFHIENRHPQPTDPGKDEHEHPSPVHAPPSDDPDPDRGDRDGDTAGQPPLTAVPRPTRSEQESSPGADDRDPRSPRRSSSPAEQHSPAPQPYPTEHESVDH